MDSSFHLSYVPASASLSDDDYLPLKNTNNENDNGDDIPITTPIIVRRAKSLRLYRCRGNHHVRQCTHGDNVGSDEHKDDHSSAMEQQQQQNEDCECCCCRVDRCSPDYLGPFNSQMHSYTDNIMDINTTSQKMLAVLVPSSLTRSLVNIVDSQRGNNSIHNMKDDNSTDNKLVDAEIELRKSIHPCLCPNENDESQNTNHKSNDKKQDYERIKDQFCQTTEGKVTSTTCNPQLYVCGIITSHNVPDCINFPADVVLLGHYNDQRKNGRIRDQDHLISHYSNLLNHDTASNAPWSILKAFPVSTISILPLTMDVDVNRQKGFDVASMPCCPVCLNLIEPKHLGLPELKSHHKCSQWCSNNYSNGFDRDHLTTCANEMKLLPWPPPSHCISCQAIAQRETSIMESVTHGFQRSVSLESPLTLSPSATPRTLLQMNGQDGILDTGNSSAPPPRRQLSHSATTIQHTSHSNSCHECGMSTTLWVCLTCGVVGCGRYTRKHAAQHYTLEGHPYSLELATGRIWDYDNGSFVHRRDLVECPVLSMKWGIATKGGVGGDCPSSPLPLAASSISGSSYYGGDNNSFSENGTEWRKEQSNGLDNHHRQYDGLRDSVPSCHDSQFAHTEASKLSAPPKKSIALSQEYEALLQSALEDQSQHYEGEIAHLRAELASSLMQDTHVSDRESREIHALQKDSERLKHEVDELSSVLLLAQTNEAKHRSMSQRLLREQSISKELLEKIRNETMSEVDAGKQRMEDLEMQIADLTANLRMMSEFAKNEELSQAQIVGTVGGEKESGKKSRGKKNRRGKKR